MALDTPVAFLIFNRPEVTQRVFQQIAAARPRHLLIVGDGPRPDRPQERQRVADTRAIAQRVDWPCNVLTNFADENLGCKLRVSSGLDWVFQHHEEAIILEDDCLPDPSFFSYCSELLERYRDDQRIMAISGNNFQTGRKWGSASYAFSKYFNCWGWASWRRVWNKYDVNMATFPEFAAEGGLDAVCDFTSEEDYWYRIFCREFHGQIDSWAYAYVYMCLSQHGLTVLPNTNLISNIGFGEDATHTSKGSRRLANYPTARMPPIVHPACMTRNKEADKYIYRHHFDQKSRRVRKRIATAVRACLRGGKPPDRLVTTQATAAAQQPAKAA